MAQETDLSFIDTFKSKALKGWHIAEYDFSHPHFDTDWRKSQVVFGPAPNKKQQGVQLKLQAAPPNHPTENRFIGGSMRRLKRTHYGSYFARIKAAQGNGIVTGFFTYTGPAYQTRHDEIDIEILGRKPNHLHVAWFVDGELKNHFIPLGFDATQDFHDYQFIWTPDDIKWFVDGKMVFETFGYQNPIPKVSGFLFANIWAADPSIRNWSGTANPRLKSQAQIKKIQFTPFEPNSLKEKLAAAMR